eukprot:4389358-Amphidinium_carterae.1
MTGFTNFDIKLEGWFATVAFGVFRLRVSQCYGCPIKSAAPASAKATDSWRGSVAQESEDFGIPRTTSENGKTAACLFAAATLRRSGSAVSCSQ